MEMVGIADAEVSLIMSGTMSPFSTLHRLFACLALLSGSAFAQNPPPPDVSYLAYAFAPAEGWRLRIAGDGGTTALNDRSLHYDFSRGASMKIVNEVGEVSEAQSAGGTLEVPLQPGAAVYVVIE
jgi:hypothetical protein